MYSQQQQRYLAEAVETASPATRLVMLYDRLLLDLSRAETACATGSVVEAHTNLVHAQQIVGVLAETLDLTAWDGAQTLYDLYDYLYRELINANLTKSAIQVANAITIVRPLSAAWREAAATLASQSMVEQHSGVA